MEPIALITLKSSVCLAAGYLLYYLLLRNETFHLVKRFALLGIILTALAVPFVKLHVDGPAATAATSKTNRAYSR